MLIAACIGLVPFLSAVLWVSLRASTIKLDGIRVLVIGFATLWMLLAPILMTWGQTWVESVLTSAKADATQAAIDLSPLVSRLHRIDLAAKPVSLLFAAGFGLTFLTLRSEISTYLQASLSGVEVVFGFVLFTFVGLTSGEGAWGVLKTITLERAVTEVDWPWYPFEPWPIDTLRKLGRYSYSTALLFSAGTLFLPMMLELYSTSSNMTTRASALIAVAILGLGSTTLFAYPYWKLHTLEVRQRQMALRTIGCELEYFLPRSLQRHPHPVGGARQASELDSLLALWARIKDEPVSPTASLTVFLGRLTSTLLIPVFVVALSGVVAS